MVVFFNLCIWFFICICIVLCIELNYCTNFCNQCFSGINPPSTNKGEQPKHCLPAINTGPFCFRDFFFIDHHKLLH